jgi:glucose dehydrogenase
MIIRASWKFCCGEQTMLMRIVSLVMFFLLSVLATGQERAFWNHYGGSQRGTQYSFQQMTRENLPTLQEAWRYRSGETGSGINDLYMFQANPIHVDNELYIVTRSAIVIALNPANGREIWRHDPLPEIATQRFVP